MPDGERSRDNQHDARGAAHSIRHDGQRLRPVEPAVEKQRNAERHDSGECGGFSHGDEAAVDADDNDERHEQRGRGR